MGKKSNIERAVEAIGFSVSFETQKRNGKTEKYATFRGFTGPCDREFEATEFYDKLEDLPDKLYDRYIDFDVDEEARLYLNAAQNGLSGVPGICELVKDLTDECEQINVLSDAVRAGLAGKVPESAKCEPAVYALNRFFEKMRAEADDPESPITMESIDRLKDIWYKEFDIHLDTILREWARDHTVTIKE